MSDKRTHPNKVTAYLKPKNKALFTGFVDANEVSNSEALNMIVKDFFQRLPDSQKIDFLSRSRTKNTY